MKKKFPFLFFLLLYQIVFSQNYKTIDATVKRYPVYENLNALSIRVNNDFLTDEDKVRAFYIWITLNIDYNLSELNNPRKLKTIYYRTQTEYQSKKRESNLIKLQKIINERKTICSGFSLMFKELCDLSNIESNVVFGFTKISADEISSNRNIKDHAWNVVKIKGEWKLIDITWSTGYMDPSSKSWVKALDDFYFFTKPEFFLTTHYPQISKWQLVAAKIDRETFFSSPIFYPKFFESGLVLNPTQSGIINVIPNKNKVVVNFKNHSKRTNLYYSFSGDSFIKPIHLKKQKDNTYAASLYGYKLKDKTLTLYLDTDPIIDFIIKK